MGGKRRCKDGGGTSVPGSKSLFYYLSKGEEREGTFLKAFLAAKDLSGRKLLAAEALFTNEN